MVGLSLTRHIPRPNSSHAILCHPEIYAERYASFQGKREKLEFRLRDSALSSIVRMYEMLLSGLGTQLGQEAEYFTSRKWRVKDIPDPTRLGWEYDLERERVFQALGIILVDALNYHIVSGASKDAGDLHCLPTWARTTLESVEIDHLHAVYPGLGFIYHYLPRRQLSFTMPPCRPETIVGHEESLERFYRHRDKLMSLPLFAERDTDLASLCRTYELFILKDVILGLTSVFEKEVGYLVSRLAKSGLKNIPDPRKRWEKFETYEPEAFNGLRGMVEMLAGMETIKGQPLPSWAVLESVGTQTQVTN
jgi:hypothetical protein